MEKTVSVIIPNYNGEGLLKSNLPKVIKYLSNAELIVVDDASTDSSCDLIIKEFKSIKLLKLNKNSGFAKAVNRGVEAARGDFVILLNTDVTPKKNFLKQALDYFKNTDTFGVGFNDASHENGRVINRGRGGARFTRGFLTHFPLSTQKGFTLWVSGGSSIIDKKKFLELGGFDEVYSPYYWEDIDLCFRAWKKGYKCYFEPSIKVDHFHEAGSIKSTQSTFKIKSTAYRNQFLFVWKNIEDENLIFLHLLFLPYHFAKSIINLDYAFFSGFLLAIFNIPSLYLSSDKNQYNISDKEVLKLIGK